MELTVNEILKNEITKLDHTLVPPGFHGDVRNMRAMQDRLSEIIDALGEQSAKAQGLRRVITTTKKLRDSPENTLYLLKDAKAKGGEGEAIGLLKVGHKNLYLYDERNQTCEVKPLCVLDFFVLQDRQRRGYGRTLFDFMLQDTGSSAVELAVDGPSQKMEQFLCRNYGIERLVRHSNNFAVTPQFFANCDVKRDSGRHTPSSTPAVGRFTAPKPQSTIATVIHGGGGNSGQWQGENGGGSSRRRAPSKRCNEYTPVSSRSMIAKKSVDSSQAKPSQGDVEPASATLGKSALAPLPEPPLPPRVQTLSHTEIWRGSGRYASMKMKQCNEYKPVSSRSVIAKKSVDSSQAKPSQGDQSARKAELRIWTHSKLW